MHQVCSGHPLPERPMQSAMASDDPQHAITSTMTITRNRKKILFLCAANACRSQMAKRWSRHLKADPIEACLRSWYSTKSSRPAPMRIKPVLPSPNPPWSSTLASRILPGLSGVRPGPLTATVAHGIKFGLSFRHFPNRLEKDRLAIQLKHPIINSFNTFGNPRSKDHYCHDQPT